MAERAVLFVFLRPFGQVRRRDLCGIVALRFVLLRVDIHRAAREHTLECTRRIVRADRIETEMRGRDRTNDDRQQCDDDSGDELLHG